MRRSTGCPGCCEVLVKLYQLSLGSHCRENNSQRAATGCVVPHSVEECIPAAARCGSSSLRRTQHVGKFIEHAPYSASHKEGSLTAAPKQPGRGTHAHARCWRRCGSPHACRFSSRSGWRTLSRICYVVACKCSEQCRGKAGSKVYSILYSVYTPPVYTLYFGKRVYFGCILIYTWVYFHFSNVHAKNQVLLAHVSRASCTALRVLEIDV